MDGHYQVMKALLMGAGRRRPRGETEMDVLALEAAAASVREVPRLLHPSLHLAVSARI